MLVAGLTAILLAGGTWFLLYRNPAADSNQRLTHFRECGQESGITFRMSFLPSEQGENFKTNLYDHGCGVVVGDFDGDGLDDIYFLNQMGPNALYRNKGDGTFEDVTAKAGVGLGDRVCVGATFADYDNSGRQSLFVTSTRGGNVLFHNNGDGTFTNVTKQAGLTHFGHSQTAVFFDYDNDGYLDLFVTNSAQWTYDDRRPGAHFYPGKPGLPELLASKVEHNILYHNEPDGKGGRRFVDVTDQAGVAGQGWGGDVAVFDFNEDGHMDLFVSCMFGPGHLYQNNGHGAFTDVRKEVLGRTCWGTIGSKVFDFNNDGKLDLLLVDMHSDMWLRPVTDPRDFPADDLKKKYSNPMGLYGFRKTAVEDLYKVANDEVIFGNTLFQKRASGHTFKEVSDEANMETWWPWGIATGDFDNDGFEDVFLPSGMGYPYFYWPNALMMNNGNGTFTDRAEAAGVEPPRGGPYKKEPIGGMQSARSSRCAAVADFEGKGRLGLVVNNFNDHPYYFRNHFPQRNYIEFRLQGVKSNRDAIGALVKLYVGDEVMVRQVQAAGGYLSQSSKAVHFGLGDRPGIDRVKIRWPSGRKQTIEKPDMNKLHSLTEPEVDS
jgi:enediyne biosynthesis protein E4